MYKRIFLIVADSVGCGTAPLSYKFGDDGANTIGHISEVCNGINLPTLESMGYGNITDIIGVKKIDNPIAYYGKMDELSNAKDTMAGHWEMMGIETKTPFVTFTDTGFPKELIEELEAKTGYKVIGNKAASGTEIIKELGEEHIKTKAMIVYTSADSVLQIACHEKYFGLDELYRVCKIAREICMKDEYKVGRVIARPFIGENSLDFKRTANRHDYALSPTGKTVLDSLKENNYDVISIGKIFDIFNGMGLTESNRTVSNHDGMEKIIDIIKNRDFKGLCFLNLVDFDALYGHRRNSIGYKDALEEFDRDLNEMIRYLKQDDLIIITADHGNDPTWRGTDHTREYVPLIVYNGLGKGNLGTRKTFSDIGETIAENFNLESTKIGKSFLKEIE
jgi:phosphopentomutase